MKGDRLGRAMHRELAENVAALRTGSFYAAALECHLRKFLHVEEFWTAQMIVPFLDARIDAADVYLSHNRGIFRMLAVDLDLAAESCEFSMSGAEKLMHRETNGRAGRIEFVGLNRRCGVTEARN